MKKRTQDKPAFPVVCNGDPGRGHNPGMTIRQYYAAQAPAGEMSAQSDSMQYTHGTAAQLADLCFAIADAMIAHEQKEAANA